MKPMVSMINLHEAACHDIPIWWPHVGNGNGHTLKDGKRAMITRELLNHLRNHKCLVPVPLSTDMYTLSPNAKYALESKTPEELTERWRKVGWII